MISTSLLGSMKVLMGMGAEVEPVVVEGAFVAEVGEGVFVAEEGVEEVFAEEEAGDVVAGEGRGEERFELEEEHNVEVVGLE